MVVVIIGVAGKRSASMSEQPAEPISMPMMGAGRLERSCEPEVPEPHSDRGVGELMTRFSNSMPSRLAECA